MQAFHNDPAIKQLYIDRLRRHAEADEIIQGTGWKNGKGCAVGCTLEAYQHSLYPTELGILEDFAHLEDRIFEGLSNAEAMAFPLAFLDAFPVGMTEADQRMVIWRFKAWVLTPIAEGGFATVVDGYPDVTAAVQRVRSLIDREIQGLDVSDDDWEAAESEAEAAAWTAYAAWPAAAAAEAERSIRSARSVRSVSWAKVRDKVIELVSTCGGGES